jgi:uncharacterized protein (DUF427 family)
MRPIKSPGPDHPITIEPSRERVVIRLAGRVVADSTKALILREAGYPPAVYIPRTDIDFSILVQSDHQTYCPYKGDCVYFSAAGFENIAWCYQAPYPAVTEIKNHLAFYPDRIDPPATLSMP